ncbi:MAG: DUF2939 domain-containing protein [Thermodesulfobacteriota bacterium]|nr:DUF2939 domain-containing protein [Candidatus Dadabacteria bacterium]|tara:strand:+ start:7364 stop:8011 length:648 start_codon:yes stop_codon:yes gene_type:complete
MKVLVWFLLFISLTLFLSPAYSLYKIGIAIKEKDKATLNAYILWSELQESLKKDVNGYVKRRAKQRKDKLDNPVEGIFEDLKRFGGRLFGDKALEIAVAKIVTPEGIIKIVEISENKNEKLNKTSSSKNKNTKNDNKLFNLYGYSLKKFNFISLSDFEAEIITPDGDIYFKMRMVFPRWHLYQVKSEKIAEEIAKRIEDSTDLLKNFKKGLENSE